MKNEIGAKLNGRKGDRMIFNNISFQQFLKKNKFQQKLLDGELYDHIPHSGELTEIVDYILMNKKDIG